MSYSEAHQRLVDRIAECARMRERCNATLDSKGELEWRARELDARAALIGLLSDVPEKSLMTPHDAATRERVAKAIYIAIRRHAKTTISHAALCAATDAALSALQPPPKGWEVSGKSLGAFNAAHDSAGGNLLNRRMCAMRAAVPHLLRDLAGGVSEAQIDRAWNAAADLNANTPLNFLRALADTLEGK